LLAGSPKLKSILQIEIWGGTRLYKQSIPKTRRQRNQRAVTQSINVRYTAPSHTLSFNHINSTGKSKATMTQWKYESTGDEVVAAFRERVRGKTSMSNLPPREYRQ
jgi:hypothetical protein